jgi:hypothetical protein
MTRETKLGIGISMALLVLVGLAVGRAWLGGSTTTEVTGSEAVAVTPAEAAPVKKAPTPVGRWPTEAAHPGEPLVLTGHKTPESAPHKLADSLVSSKGSDISAPPDLPEMSAPPAPSDGIAQRMPQAPLVPTPPPGPAVPDVQMPPALPGPTSVPQNTPDKQKKPNAHPSGDPAPAAPMPPGLPEPVNVAQNATNTTAQPAQTVPAAPPAPPAGPPSGPATTPANSTEALLHSQMQKANAAAPTSPTAPLAPGPTPPAAPPADTPAGPPATPPPTGTSAPPKASDHPLAEPGQSAAAPVAPMPPAPAATGPAVPPAAPPAPTAVASATLPNPTPPPTLGGQAPAAGPPVRAPEALNGPSAAPPVKVQESEAANYNVTAEAQTLEAISKLKYGSEKYARAIRLYNGKFLNDDVSETTPLKVGQRLLIPPAQVLEKEYPSEIQNYQPARPAVATGPVTDAAPLGSAFAPSAGPPVNLGRPSMDKTVNYTVRPGGEHMWEIARDHLGDGRRWSEIYRLNPSIPPEQPVPGGTVLRLPADARN